jgi:hypothetical protein
MHIKTTKEEIFRSNFGHRCISFVVEFGTPMAECNRQSTKNPCR